jgi:DNA-binding transcriptional LysR family regulator
MVHRVQVRSRLRVNESKALLSAALDGFGVVLGPLDFLKPAIATGQLIPLLTDFQAPVRQMHLLYSADRQRTAKLRSFIDAAVEYFGPSADQP